MGIVDTIISSPVASTFGAIVVTAVGGIIVQVYRQLKRQQDQVRQWYGGALGLVGKLQQASYQTTTYDLAEYHILREKLEPIVAASVSGDPRAGILLDFLRHRAGGGSESTS